VVAEGKHDLTALLCAIDARKNGGTILNLWLFDVFA
jgi:hypothetical protein